MEFVESYMRFSFDDDILFRIEKDPILSDLEGYKACECVVLINEHVALIEAKSSSPHPDNKGDFDAWITEIKEKFADSLTLFDEIRKKRFGEEAFSRIPSSLRDVQIDSKKYIIYLIVHGNAIDWMPGIQDALREAMRDVVNQWNLLDSNIKAINDEIALERKLIVEILPRDEA